MDVYTNLEDEIAVEDMPTFMCVYPEVKAAIGKLNSRRPPEKKIITLTQLWGQVEQAFDLVQTRRQLAGYPLEPRDGLSRKNLFALLRPTSYGNVKPWNAQTQRWHPLAYYVSIVAHEKLQTLFGPPALSSRCLMRPEDENTLHVELPYNTPPSP